ncbi:MAG: CDP-paratose 2-epimerase, partial [Caldithrix sp.]|nr:CDP-paratose 2-epimerase [Caldithrix sp.]
MKFFPEFNFYSESWIERPVDEVFEFFSHAENLQVITPPWLSFQILTPQPISMAAGTLIDYRLKLYGLPMKWKTEISVWEPPYRFIDAQLKGPYKKWVHEHRFIADNGGTRITDSVDYAIPGGPFSYMIHKMSVRGNI